jgi:hypothetical protein
MTAVALLTAYMSGAAVTETLVSLYARDGIDITPGRRVLTADEFAAISALAATLPSTPANNAWD